MGVWRLYIGPSRAVARMEFVCGFWPGRGYICHVRSGGHHRAPGLTPAIRRSIWSGLLCSPSHTAGHVCIPELLCFYLFGDVVLAGVRAELPLCIDHAVVGLPHYMLAVLAPAPRRQIEVAICALGSFFGRSSPYSSAARTSVHLSVSRS